MTFAALSLTPSKCFKNVRAKACKNLPHQPTWSSLLDCSSAFQTASAELNMQPSEKSTETQLVHVCSWQDGAALDLVFQLLPLACVPTLRSVCKEWLLCTSKLRSLKHKLPKLCLDVFLLSETDFLQDLCSCSSSSLEATLKRRSCDAFYISIRTSATCPCCQQTEYQLPCTETYLR